MTEKDQREKNREDWVNVNPPRKRRIDVVPIDKIHFSAILPRRDSKDDEVSKSVLHDAVQVPLIVRPLPWNPEEYEAIDGALRLKALKANPHQQVLVEIRYGVTDSEVFRISHATSRVKPKTAYEKARFFSQWVWTVIRKRGKTGAQSWVARLARRSEGEISQYVAIDKMFRELEIASRSDSIDLDALKNQNVNKLYELSKLRENPALLQVAKELADHPNTPIRTLRRRVRAHETKMKKPHRRSTTARVRKKPQENTT